MQISFRFSALIVGLILFFNTTAQIPTGYYNSAAGLTGAPLKTALYNIIKGHTVQSYPLWSWYDNTDLQTNGKIWDIYSDNCNFTFSTDQCGSYSNICDCYNNEHSFPKSWFNDVSPMNSDIFHIYPTDGKVNGMRSNYPFGETSTGTVYGNGKLGNSTFVGYTNIVFEPADQYKGDLARTYFYMVTRYENVVASWENYDTNGDAMLNGTSFPCFEPWALSLLLKWNTQDPVSQKEIDRNNKIYSLVQHNRNPFIDHPEWVTSIWGPAAGINDMENTTSVSIFPNPAISSIHISLNAKINKPYELSLFKSDGTNIFTKQELSKEEEIDFSGLPDGVYFVKIKSDSFSKIEKVVIIK
ncbi:MAG: endonuclease [Bacteroidia bacterium]|nr:endonuclease [Bacteroidia bacterium]